MVVEHRVAVEKGAAPAVLTAQAHPVTVLDQRGIGQQFRESPIHGQGASRHLAPVVDDTFHARMKTKILRKPVHHLGQLAHTLRRQRGLGRLIPVPLAEVVPLHGELVADHAGPFADNVAPLIQALAIGLDHGAGIRGRQNTHLAQMLGIQGATGGQLLDMLVHQGLGDRRLVGLVVTLAAIAHQVDHHVLVELHAIFQRQPGDEQHRLGVIRIHMENGRLHHLGHVGAVHRRPRIPGIAGGESHLIVDHDVHRAPHAVTPRLGHIEHLHHHTLAGEGCIAVDQHGQHPIPRAVPSAILARTHRAQHHRVDNLEVGRIERQHQMHQAIVHPHIGGKAHVVLHIPRIQRIGQVVLSLEFLEQLARRLAQDIDQHIEAPAMGHADHHLVHAAAPGVADQVIKLGNEGIAAFQRETLLTHIAGMQVFFDALGGGELQQHMAPLLGRQLQTAPTALQALLDPAFAARIHDVHVFGADGAGVNRTHQIQNLPQRKAFFRKQRAGIEHRVHVALAQTMEARIEIGHRRALPQPQRVEPGHLMPPHPIGIDESQNSRLALGRCGAQSAIRSGTGRADGFLAPDIVGKRTLDGPVGDIPGLTRRLGQALKVGSPARIRDAVGVLEEFLIVTLDERSIAAVQRRAAVFVPQVLAHGASPWRGEKEKD